MQAHRDSSRLHAREAIQVHHWSLAQVLPWLMPNHYSFWFQIVSNYWWSIHSKTQKQLLIGELWALYNNQYCSITRPNIAYLVNQSVCRGCKVLPTFKQFYRCWKSESEDKLQMKMSEDEDDPVPAEDLKRKLCP
jgi:hypothetical protein